LARRDAHVRQGSPRHPVEQVSHDECFAVLRRSGWVLPTEARWEYACRAGTTTPWWCDEQDLHRAANLRDPAFFRRHQQWDAATDKAAGDDGHADPAPVGSLLPNPFGLHDVVGNVWEWCLDADGPYDQPGRAGDGLRTSDAVNHIHRGGSYVINARFSRSSMRNRYPPASRSPSVGVRAARELAP
jgi:formylglycine-generating enzyme required for sulfatase activity